MPAVLSFELRHWRGPRVFELLLLLGRESNETGSDAPASNATFKALSLFGFDVATIQEFAHTVEIGVVEHSSDRRLEIGFEVLDYPEPLHQVKGELNRRPTELVSSRALTKKPPLDQMGEVLDSIA
jgi:hypothetical protein